MILEFMWHEIKVSVAGQMSCNQISKHGVTTINSKYENDNKIHVALSQLSSYYYDSFNLYVSVYGQCHILPHTSRARLVIEN